MSKEFLDWTATQGSGAGLDMLGNALRKGIGFDAFGGKRQFKARALTNAFPLNDAEGALFLETDYGAPPNTGPPGEPAADNAPIGYSQYIFKARIIGENSPHAFLPDPCDDAFLACPEKAIPYVMMHTSFVTDINATTDDFQYIKKGDIIIVELNHNEFAYDLQFGKFVRIANTRVQNITQRAPEACASLEGLFEDAPGPAGTVGSPGTGIPAAGLPAPQTPNTPARIQEAADNYDASTTLPNKSQHTPFFSQAHTDFVPYIKAFMFNAWNDAQATIRINQVYRTPQRSAEMRAEYEAGSRTIRPSTTSFHLWGMALDFNPTIDGVTIRGPQNRAEKQSRARSALWHSSGIVAAGEKANLYWGGRFRTNYDPIHFDFRNVAGSSADLIAFSEAQGGAPNRINIG